MKAQNHLLLALLAVLLLVISSCLPSAMAAPIVERDWLPQPNAGITVPYEPLSPPPADMSDDHTYMIPVTVTANEDMAANSTVELKVAKGSTPVENGEWEVDGVDEIFRVPFTITNTSSITLVDEVVEFYIDTNYLVDRGFFSTSGNETRFTDESANVLQFNKLGTWDTADTEYHIEFDLDIWEEGLFYMYGNPDGSAETYGGNSSITWWDVYEEFSTAAANIAAFLAAYTDWDDSADAPIVVVAGGILTLDGASNGVEESIHLKTDFGNMTRAEVGVNAAIENHTFFGFDGDVNDRYRVHRADGTNDELYFYRDGVAFQNDCYWPTAPYTVTMGSSGTYARIWFDGGIVGIQEGMDEEDYTFKIGQLLLTEIAIDYVKVGSSPSPIPYVNFPDLSGIIYSEDYHGSYPYDRAFSSDTDGATGLFHYVDRPSLNSLRNAFDRCFVKIPSAISSGDTYTMYMWVGGSDTSWNEWSDDGADVFTKYEDFETDYSDFTAHDGAWGNETQHTPIIKGGVETWTRAPRLVYDDDGTARLIHTESLQGYTASGATEHANWPGPFVPYSHTTDNLEWWQTDGLYLNPYDTAIGQSDWMNGTTFPSGAWIGDIRGNDTHYYGTMTTTGTTAQFGTFRCDDTADDYTEWDWSANNPVLDGADLGAWAKAEPTLASNSFLYNGNSSKGDVGWYHFYAANTVVDSRRVVGFGTASTWDGTVTDRNWLIQHSAVAGTVAEAPYVFDDGTQWVCQYSYGGGPQTIKYEVCSYTDFGAAMDNTDWGGGGAITMTSYDWNSHMRGMSSVYNISASDWTMFMYGTSEDEAAQSCKDQENYIGYYETGNISSQAWTAEPLSQTYQNSTGDAKTHAYVTGGSYGNITIQAEIMIDDGEPSAGLLWRHEDTENYYIVQLADSTNNFVFDRWGVSENVADSWNVLASGDINFRLQYGHVYQLRVDTFDDDTFQVYMSPHGDDWELLYDSSDATHDATGVSAGMHSSDSKANFDNFIIYPAYGSLPTISSGLIVTTVAATEIKGTSAQLNGTIDFASADASSYAFVWDTVTRGVPSGAPAGDYANSWTVTPSGAYGVDSYDHSPSLSPNTEYFFRFGALGDGWVWGDELTLTTTSGLKPNPWLNFGPI